MHLCPLNIEGIRRVAAASAGQHTCDPGVAKAALAALRLQRMPKTQVPTPHRCTPGRIVWLNGWEDSCRSTLISV